MSKPSKNRNEIIAETGRKDKPDERYWTGYYCHCYCSDSYPVTDMQLGRDLEHPRLAQVRFEEKRLSCLS